MRTLEESLAATPIERIHGIVNGTTNYILTEMSRGASYAEALAEAQRNGYAEADPSDDVSGRDAAAKMAILARLAFGTPVHLDEVRCEGIENLHSDDLAYARELDLGLKLVGTAERRQGGLSVCVYPTFLYSGHPLASISGSFNAVTVESDTITEITLSGPGAGGRQTASAVLGDVVSVMTGGARPPAPPLALPLIEDVESAFYLHLDVADRPGVLATVTQVLGEQLVSIKSVVQRGHGRACEAGDGHPPGARVGAARRRRAARGVRLRTLGASDDPGDRRGVPVSLNYAPVPLPRIQGGVPTGAHVPLIERYLDRLPFEAGDKLVSLQEGSTPLLQAPVVSAMVGATVRLKLEGGNPTGSFKDRGMTCALSAAVRDGAKAVICASTGNTAASAAAYAARAGITCAVIVPEGKIAQGKMAQTLVHGARVISLRGNFDQALDTRARADRDEPDRARQLRQRVPHRRAEDGRVRDPRGARRRARRALHPGRQRRQHHLLLARLPGAGRRAADARLPGGRAPRRSSRATRSSTRKRSRARSGSATRCAGRTRWRPRRDSRGSIRVVTDEEILEAYRLLAYREGMFCEPASAASVAGLLKYGAEGAEQVVCVLTGPRAEGPGDRDRQQRRAHDHGARRDRRDRGSGAG